MLQTLSYFPGQTATIFLEVLDGYGERADSYVDGYVDGYEGIPVITRLVFPDLTLAEGYPTIMTKLDVGLYYYQFVLPVGATAVGSYLVDISYINPTTLYTNTALYQIAVNAPFGNYGTTVGSYQYPHHHGGK